LEVMDVPRQQRHEITQNCLQMVGLSGCDDLYPKQLSAGMKQRVGIARALTLQPDLLLMDEAFSEIDEFSAEALREELAWIHFETSQTFVLATHNLLEAIYLADKIVVLSPRPAKVRRIIQVNLDRPRYKEDSAFIEMHRHVFGLLREELRNSILSSYS